MSFSNLKHTAELAYEKDKNRYVMFYPNEKNPKEIDSLFINSLDKIKPAVKDHNIETLICWENRYTGMNQDKIDEVTRSLFGKKKEKKCCVLRESDPMAAVTYNTNSSSSD